MKKKLLTLNLLALFSIATIGTLPAPQSVVCAQKKNDDKPKKNRPGPPVVRDKKDKPPPSPAPPRPRPKKP